MKFLIFAFSLIIFHPFVLANSTQEVLNNLDDTGKVFFQTVIKLLEINPHIKNSLGRAPPHNAIVNNQPGKIYVVPNIQNDIGRIPLHFAVAEGDIGQVKKLYKNKLDKQDKRGRAPMHIAIVYKQSDIFLWLLEEGANPDMQDNKGDTLLHFAIKYNSSKIARWLLDEGANPYIKNNKGIAPLLYAAKLDRKEIANIIANSILRGQCKGAFK